MSSLLTQEATPLPLPSDAGVPYSLSTDSTLEPNGDHSSAGPIQHEKCASPNEKQNDAPEVPSTDPFKHSSLQPPFPFPSDFPPYKAPLDPSSIQAKITELETQLVALKDAVASGKGIPLPAAPAEIVHDLKRTSASDFTTTRESVATSSRKWALEVLTSAAPEAHQENGQTSSSSNGDRTFGAPERLRVRSSALIAHLRKVTGALVQDGNSTSASQSGMSAIVFFRPFKLFVEHESAIRKSLDELESQAPKEKEKHQEKGEEESTLSHIGDLPKPENPDNQDLLQDLRLLIRFFDEDLRETFRLRSAIKSGSVVDIQYCDLWHLFERGDIVVNALNPSNAYQVAHFTGGRESLQKHKTATSLYPGATPNPEFTINCFTLAFDGASFIPNLETIKIRPFSGLRKIQLLPVYPLKFHTDPSMDTKLVEQGRQYLDYAESAFSHRSFTGKTVDEPAVEMSGQVIVDMKTAHKIIPTQTLPQLYSRPSNTVFFRDQLTLDDEMETSIPSFCGDGGREGCCGGDFAHKDYEVDRNQLDKFLETKNQLAERVSSDLTDEDCKIMPYWVYGFALRSRRWLKLRMADLEVVNFHHKLKSLLLPETYKDTIQAMVRTHKKGGSVSDEDRTSLGSGIDVIQGKGTGMIFLLHGQPGVGKTMTAECVADDTKKPLFQMTCGDIGETAEEVERNLQTSFELSQKWECILLLDEADVFLAKRNKSDLRRNAVVSVFLRHLEYYGGILFLTTNRVGGIDPAFKSRVHLSLLYPPIGKKETTKLYKIFIKRIKEEQHRLGKAKFKVDKDEIVEFAKSHFNELKRARQATWNGRQIRNAFQAAIAIVEHESHRTGNKGTARLGRAQFEIFAKASKQFEDYLKQTIGETEAKAALREQLRSDGFRHLSPSPPPRASKTRGKKAGRSHHNDDHRYSQSESSSEDSSSEETSSSEEEEEEDEEESEGVDDDREVNGNGRDEAAEEDDEDSDDDTDDSEDAKKSKKKKKKKKSKSKGKKKMVAGEEEEDKTAMKSETKKAKKKKSRD